MNSGKVMVDELEKLAVEVKRVKDSKLKRQFKSFVKAMHVYMAELDSLLKVMTQAHQKVKR